MISSISSTGKRWTFSGRAKTSGQLAGSSSTPQAQKTWIETNLLRKLEASLQQLAGSPAVRLQVEAAQYVEETKIYLPSEQAKDLMSKNEEVKNLVIDLDLDV